MEISQTRTFLKEGAYKNKGFFFYYYQIVEDYGAVWIPRFCVAFSAMRVFLLLFSFFSFFLVQPQLLTNSPVNSARMYCSRTHKFHFLATFSLKMGPTILFTYLKIILLQRFQFSVSTK